MMVPTMEDIERYLESVEEVFFSSLSAATPDLPNMRQTVNRLWDDVSRYGPSGMPSFKEIRVPGLGDFHVPPPPPPIPPKSWFESSTDWISEHPWKTSGMVLGVIGVGLFVGYSAVQTSRERVIRIKPVSRERRQVVVVLGGDHPLAFPLIADLEKRGYIVIASVASPETVDVIERKSHGYVCALVLDPNEPGTIPVFLRSLSSTLSRRFPLNTSGDPHASLSSLPYTHSVISLLTLPSSTTVPPPAPLEHLSLRNTYLPYLTATHITPLQVLQALMPLLRTTPARSRDAAANTNGKKTIVVCLPANDARVGLPFASVQAMSAAATLRGVEVLRREINAAAVTDKSESMKHIKVVVVDVGAVSLGGTDGPLVSEFMSPQEVYKATEDWTPSEKLTYGPSFASIARVVTAAAPPQQQPPTSTRWWEAIWRTLNGTVPFGVVRRKPADVSVFVDALVGIVSGGGGGKRGSSLFKLGLGMGRIKNWIRGERVAVGAGANVYGIASHLPSYLLDAIVNIPHFMMSVRNSLLPVPPALPQSHLPPPEPPIVPVPASADEPSTAAEAQKAEGSDQESGNDASEPGSEADVESNAGDGSGVDNSWVSLKKREKKSLE